MIMLRGGAEKKPSSGEVEGSLEGGILCRPHFNGFRI
jgi:hypothetical protein